MNIVVTGATSFIGLPMIQYLSEEGHQVFAVVRPGSANRNRLSGLDRNVRIIAMELGDLDEIDQMIQAECQCYFHFGWEGSGSENRTKREVQQQNVTDSLKALIGASKLGCERFLFSGSQAEYGICEEAMTEETPCRPVSEYGIAKQDFYREALTMTRKREGSVKTPIEYLHARIFSIYGPGDHPWSLVETCLSTFLKDGHMDLGECIQQWNFLHVDDLIRGLAALMFHKGKAAPDGIYNVAGPEAETKSLRCYVEEIHQLCGGRGSFTYGSRKENAEGPANLIPDITRLEKLTGWRPETSFSQGIRARIEELREKNR